MSKLENYYEKTSIQHLFTDSNSPSRSIIDQDFQISAAFPMFNLLLYNVFVLDITLATKMKF